MLQIDPETQPFGQPSGDVELGDDVSVWPCAVVRGDMHRIRIGARTSVQDGSVLHVTHDGEFSPGGAELHIHVTDTGPGMTDEEPTKCPPELIQAAHEDWDLACKLGEMYGYRTDRRQSAAVRASVTPRTQADRPVGQWNRFEITVRGSQVSVHLNGVHVVETVRYGSDA